MMVDPTTISLVSITMNIAVIAVLLLSMKKASADREAMIRSLAIAVRPKSKTMLNGGTSISPRCVEEAEDYIKSTMGWGEE